jgi:hypothetical protein
MSSSARSTVRGTNSSISSISPKTNSRNWRTSLPA